MLKEEKPISYSFNTEIALFTKVNLSNLLAQVHLNSPTVLQNSCPCLVRPRQKVLLPTRSSVLFMFPLPGSLPTPYLVNATLKPSSGVMPSWLASGFSSLPLCLLASVDRHVVSADYVHTSTLIHWTPRTRNGPY